MEHVGHIVVTWLVPSPSTADKFAQIYQDLMMDRNVLSGMGPAAIRAAKMIMLNYWRNLIPAAFGMWSGDRLVFRPIFRFLPNWGKLGKAVGIPMVDGFEYAWIEGEDIMTTEKIGSGKCGTVARGKYKGIDVCIKYVINKKIDYQDVIVEAAIAVQMGELGIGPPVIGLQIADGRTSQLPGIVMRYFPGSITVGDMLENLQDYNPRHIIKVMASVAIKTDKIHLHGYLHNDMKATNIILVPDANKTKEFTVYIIDYGRATTVEFAEHQPQKAPMKLQRRFAPEIAQGQQLSKKSDVFSFGYLLNKVIRSTDNLLLTRTCLTLAKRCCFEKAALRPTMTYIKNTLQLDTANN